MKKILLILAVAFFVQTGSLALAYDSELTRPALRGLKSFHVEIIGDPDPELEKLGLTHQQIKTDVELKLRLAGIGVIEEFDFPVLDITINFINVKARQCYVYSIELSVSQVVFLQRDRSISSVAKTWSIGGLGAGTKIKSIRNGIKDYTDKFINAYLSVNPK